MVKYKELPVTGAVLLYLEQRQRPLLYVVRNVLNFHVFFHERGTQQGVGGVHSVIITPTLLYILSLAFALLIHNKQR